MRSTRRAAGGYRYLTPFSNLAARARKADHPAVDAFGCELDLPPWNQHRFVKAVASHGTRIPIACQTCVMVDPDATKGEGFVSTIPLCFNSTSNYYNPQLSSTMPNVLMKYGSHPIIPLSSSPPSYDVSDLFDGISLNPLAPCNKLDVDCLPKLPKPRVLFGDLTNVMDAKVTRHPPQDLPLKSSSNQSSFTSNFKSFLTNFTSIPSPKKQKVSPAQCK